MKRFLFGVVLVSCGARTGTKMTPDDAAVADAPTVQPPIGSDASPPPPPPPPPPPMTNAVLINDCAPNDGPAYVLRVGPDPLTCTPSQTGTFDEITVWSNVPAGFGMVNVTSGKNGMTRVCNGSTCTDGVAANISFTVITSTEVRGNYSIKVAPMAHNGTFVGKRCNNMAMCG